MLSPPQFYAQVAQELGNKITNKDAKKVVGAIGKVVSGEIAQNRGCRIPGIAVVKVWRKAAREAGMRKVFGKDIQVAAKPAISKVRMTALKPLRSKLP